MLLGQQKFLSVRREEDYNEFTVREGLERIRCCLRDEDEDEDDIRENQRDASMDAPNLHSLSNAMGPREDFRRVASGSPMGFIWKSMGRIFRLGVRVLGIAKALYTRRV